MATQSPTSPYRDSISSDLDTASDSGDVTSQLPQKLGERTSYDQQVLDEEDEREELLTGKARRSQPSLRPSSNTRKRRKGKKKGDGEEAKELIYDRDMEEGKPSSRRSSSSTESSAADREKIGAVQAQHTRPSRLRRCCRIGIVNTIIAVVFVAIAYGAYQATRKDARHNVTLVSNGTELFAPTTIIVSLDGFRADFLHRGLTPTLNAFIKQGVSPEYTLPSFPSVTFPNHYTLVTGLYPESHGVVGNTFWDPTLKEEFYYTHPSAMHPKWWGGEPLWVTAEKQGVRMAVHMWPGSEAHIMQMDPSFLDKFNGSEVLTRKVDRILELLDKPSPDGEHIETVVPDQRPQMIMAYVPNVDADGHKFGPNSTEIRETIKDVDSMLADLFDGLEKRNLTEIVNVVVVSDHGMATTSVDRLIQFEDLVDPKYFDHMDGWPLYGLRPKDPDMLDMLYDHLVKESKQREGFDVYLRDLDMPKKYHFSNNERIAPLWLVPHTGWAIVKYDEFDVQEGKDKNLVYHPRGLHGYDYQNPLMRSIFVARGPAFPHKPGSKIDVFQNIEVYNILCDSVHIDPKPNNGTLRLPFKTTGIHSDKQISKVEDVADPPTSTPPSVLYGVEKNVSRPVLEKINGTDIDLANEKTWPDWFRSKFDSIKDWIEDVFGIHKSNGTASHYDGGKASTNPTKPADGPSKAAESDSDAVQIASVTSPAASNADGDPPTPSPKSVAR